jgi:hypothetical protein
MQAGVNQQLGWPGGYPRGCSPRRQSIGSRYPGAENVFIEVTAWGAVAEPWSQASTSPPPPTFMMFDVKF